MALPDEKGLRRRILSEELGNSIFRVLDPKAAKAFLPEISVGVGTSFIVHDPDTFQTQMLFTGWEDVTGRARRIYVSNIDEDLRVTNVRRIADGGLFGVTGLNTVSAVWDDYNEQWIVSATAYGVQWYPISCGYFMFFDKTWALKDRQEIDFEQSIGGTMWVPSLDDGGLGMVVDQNKRLIMSGGFGLDRSLFSIPDVTARPLRSPTLGNQHGTNRFPIIPSYFSDMADVHQLFVYNGRPVILSELVHSTNNWFCHVYFFPERDWNMVGNVDIGGTMDMVGKYMTVTPVSTNLIPHNYTHVIGNMGHPHYSTLLGRPLLFFATFPTCNMDGKRKYSHEIWATSINPIEAFDPTKNFPLVASGVSSEPFLIGKVPIPTFGAKTATIILFGVAGPGTLNFIESNSPYHIWFETTTRAISNYSISAGANKLIINQPAPYISLKTNVDLAEWMVVLN